MSAINVSSMNIVGLSRDPLWSDDFAVLLGFKKSNYSGREVHNEVERLYRLNLYLQRNTREVEGQQDIIWARFCALYLPATIDRFLDPPVPTDEGPDIVDELKLNNAYFEMLVSVQHSPYFTKCMRSQKPIAAGGKRLTQVLGERLLEFAPTIDRHIRHPPKDRPDDYFLSFIGNAVQLLSTLLTIFMKERDQTVVLSQETRDGLKPWILDWLRRYPNEFLAEPCKRVLLAINRDRRFMEDARLIRKIFRNWNQCGLPSCASTENLKACGRCQTICYCRPEHQRAHWSLHGFSTTAPHKEMCHATGY